MNVGCYSTVSDYEIPSSGCYYNLGNAISFSKVKTEINGTTRTLSLPTLVNSTASTTPRTSTFDSDDKSTMVGIARQAIITMIHKQSDSMLPSIHLRLANNYTMSDPLFFFSSLRFERWCQYEQCCCQIYGSINLAGLRFCDWHFGGGNGFGCGYDTAMVEFLLARYRAVHDPISPGFFLYQHVVTKSDL